MKSVICFARGAAKDSLKIADRPTPEPGPGEVRVRIHASGVNPSDFKVRSGAQGPLPQGADEVVPHSDGAGIIEAVGEGVLERRIGERVWLYNANRTEDGLAQGVRGTAAEQVVAAAKLVQPLPHGISFESGACLGVPALTAHRAVFADGSVEGQWILVTGGAGAVGMFAVQMAVAGGARVIASVSSDEKAAAAKGAGAEATINYRTENVAARVLEITGGTLIDRVVDVDFAAYIDDAPSYMNQGGVVAQYGTSDIAPTLNYRSLLLKNIVIRSVFVYAMSDQAKADAIADTNQWLRDGKLVPTIHQVFPIDEVVQAHEAVEAAGFIGNVVVSI